MSFINLRHIFTAALAIHRSTAEHSASGSRTPELSMQPYEPLPALARAIARCQQVRPTPTPTQTTAQNVVFLLCLWLERAWALCHVGIGNVLISAFSTLAAVALWRLA